MTRPTRRKLLGTAARSFAAASLAGPLPALLRRRSPNEALQVGVVGVGSRGRAHLQWLGYPGGTPDDEPGEPVPRIEGVEVVAVCDTFDEHLARAQLVVGRQGVVPRTYLDFREMLAKEDLDAVVIATPDFTHGPFAMEAARAGCDVYVEKCMTNTVAEALELGEVLRATGRILQVGYQLRQDELHRAAAEYVRRGYVGEVHMVQSVIRRSGPLAGWQSSNAQRGGPPREEVHWRLFLAGIAPEREYDPHRYFEWRRFWDYGTGVCGDLLSHVLDQAAMVLDLGIPASASASGGLYHWKRHRETPDTFTTVHEHPERELSVLFNCVMSNSFPEQATLFLGTEGTLELSSRLNIYPDVFSKKYEDQLRAGKLHPRRPFVSLTDREAERVQYAAPTRLWLAGRGATRTTRAGKAQSTTRLHHEDFFRCVREREQPAASWQTALGSTIGSHMSTRAYRERRTVDWDPEHRTVV